MKIFPAIDILDKKAVRLLKGKREDCTVYGDPLEMVYSFKESGATSLHIVDLNSAFDNIFVNDEIIKEIGKVGGIEIELGGGMRTVDRVKKVIEEYGFTRVIVGSALVLDEKLSENLFKLFGNKIVGGIDVLNGKIAVKGWVEYVERDVLEVLHSFKELGLTDVIYTDISKDGALCGVNYVDTAKMQTSSGLNFIASGGVSSYDDLISCKNNGIYGIILGKALYNKNITLKEALKYAD